jgi:hypothetical protein
MLLKDRFELPVTCATAAAVEDYVAAVDLLLSVWPGPQVRVSRALSADRRLGEMRPGSSSVPISDSPGDYFCAPAATLRR